MIRRLPRNTVLLGNAASVLSGLPDASVDCVITSPPYFMLRNYGTDGQLGMESTVEVYVDTLVSVMDEVRRVLKPSGSLWLNLGDGYSRHERAGALPKSLLLAPERVALAMTERHWVLRNKTIWAKPNPTPSSVLDRLSCTYEVVFHFVRSRTYFYDLDAIRVPHKVVRRGLTARLRSAKARVGPGNGKYEAADRSWAGPLAGKNDGLARARAEGRAGHRLGKNPGDVWTIPTGGYRGAHFATFPERLITRPLLATCPVRTCRHCGTPWLQQSGQATAPSCTCTNRTYQPGLVLDPFMGAGTTAVAAARLDRDWLGIELNADYRALALDRIASVVRPDARPERGGAPPTGAHHAPDTEPLAA